VIFTPFHDATHKSVSRHGWINEVIGRALSIFWLVPFPLMRFVHLAHHRNTNDRIKDPDYWSGSGSKIFLPIRWLTQDLHYLSFYIRTMPSRPRAEVLEIRLAVLPMHDALNQCYFQIRHKTSVAFSSVLSSLAKQKRTT